MANPGKTPTFSGISNPFALAEAIQGKRINWAKKPYTEKTKMLETVFDMPYGELFDPKTGSPLFRHDSIYRKKKEKGTTYGAGTPCVIPASWKDFTGTPDVITSCDIRDPVQGSIPNCWLVAAMSSVSWTRGISYSLVPGNNGSLYQFKFYGGVNQGPTSVSLPVDMSTNILYCRSSNAVELWPSLYEKAYYQWKVKNDTGMDTQMPEYCKYGTNNPLIGIEHLTGMNLNSFSVSAKNYDADACFSDIYGTTQLCTRSTVIKKISKPGIAWTLDTSAIPSSYVSEYGTADPGYDTGTLPACHCFSILGTYGKSTDLPEKKYIILRNPYGPPVGDPNMTGVLKVGTFCSYLNLADKDGVFGISAAEFVKKFAGYGWGY